MYFSDDSFSTYIKKCSILLRAFCLLIGRVFFLFFVQFIFFDAVVFFFFFFVFCFTFIESPERIRPFNIFLPFCICISKQTLDVCFNIFAESILYEKRTPASLHWLTASWYAFGPCEQKIQMPFAPCDQSYPKYLTVSPPPPWVVFFLLGFQWFGRFGPHSLKQGMIDGHWIPLEWQYVAVCGFQVRSGVGGGRRQASFFFF